MSWTYTHVERIRFGALDAMRHLNNVVFLRYFETARIAYLRHVAEHDPANPVRPGDVRRSSFRIEFEMRAADRLLAEGYGVLVGYDYAAQHALPLPDALKARLV